MFFWAMVVAGITASVAASLKGLILLLLTSVFSLYLAHQQLGQGRHLSPHDWGSMLLRLGLFAGTLTYGLWHRPFNLALVVFGE